MSKTKAPDDPGRRAGAEAARMSVDDNIAALQASYRAYFRASRKKWEAEHPEEAEIERLKEENDKLQDELSQAKSREIKRQSNREGAVALTLFFGGALILWLIFRHTCLSCDWYSPTDGLWDAFALCAIVGWSLGGIPGCFSVVERFALRRRMRLERQSDADTT